MPLPLSTLTLLPNAFPLILATVVGMMVLMLLIFIAIVLLVGGIAGVLLLSGILLGIRFILLLFDLPLIVKAFL